MSQMVNDRDSSSFWAHTPRQKAKIYSRPSETGRLRYIAQIGFDFCCTRCECQCTVRGGRPNLFRRVTIEDAEAIEEIKDK